MNFKDIKSMTLLELKESFKNDFIESYRANQVYEWITKGANSFAEMTNIPLGMRNTLNDKYFIYGVRTSKRFVSSKDDTIKYLFELYDGSFIESVLMKYKHGYSVCISTQAGCKMKCSFCATGKGKFLRDLYPSEMISQIQEIQKDNDIRISNVVLMGMGEPLDNYENTLKFLRLVSSKDGINIGMRHISLSTCGLVDKIYKLADENLQITLSVSLHAPKDELRNEIMPINRRWGIHDLINACRYYVKCTGRRISFEYAMINNFNDEIRDAERLSELLKGMLCHINLIPVNNIEEGNFQKSNMTRIKKFSDVLDRKGFNVTIRRTLGSDISASCGQLRQREML